MFLTNPSSQTHNSESLAIMSDVNPKKILQALKIILLEGVNLQPQPCLFNYELTRLAFLERGQGRTTARRRPR